MTPVMFGGGAHVLRLLVWFADRFCIDAGDGRVLVLASEAENACFVVVAPPASTSEIPSPEGDSR